MRVLWWSNHPTAPTGYGQQTAIWCRKLRDEGHDVVISANYGGEPRAHHWEDIPVLPPGEGQFGTDSLAEDCRTVEPDVTFGLYDVWAVDCTLEGRVGWWTPVDHSPLPPKVLAAVQKLGAVPVAMSQWGAEQFAVNKQPALYAPHGIDTEVFAPVDRAEARRLLGFDDDTFLVGMVAANKGAGWLRKGWDVAFQAFAALAKQHDDALLFCHTKRNPHSGIDLALLASTYQVPEHALQFQPSPLLRYGVSDRKMATLYSAFDVLLAPSLGEGFGIPVIEAQACGVPVIVTDATAQSELCGAGWKVPGHYLWDSAQAADWVRPYDALLKQALFDAYEARGDQQLQADARTFAEQYDFRVVWDTHMRDVFAELVPQPSPIVV